VGKWIASNLGPRFKEISSFAVQPKATAKAVPRATDKKNAIKSRSVTPVFHGITDLSVLDHIPEREDEIKVSSS
jgi:hypothetical protein